MSKPKCRFCKKDATCFGRYDGDSGYACDECCGHGCEDGHCSRIGEISVTNPTYLHRLVSAISVEAEDLAYRRELVAIDRGWVPCIGTDGKTVVWEKVSETGERLACTLERAISRETEWAEEATTAASSQ